MRLARTITVLAAGAATAWLLERRGLLPGRRPQAALPWPPGHAPSEPEPPGPAAEAPEPEAPTPKPEAPPPEPEAPARAPAAEDEPPPDASFAPSEQPTREQPALDPEPGPVDVSSLVDDLSGGSEDPIFDAEVVEDPAGASHSTENERLALAVRELLAVVPDVPVAAVSVAASDGIVFLSGEVERAGTIREAEERVRELDGVIEVRNLLHLPGTPPPA